MCGIAGFIGENQPIRVQTIVESMVADLKHRGPDAAGTVPSLTSCVGMTCLRIRSAEGDPVPFLLRNGVAAYNGEVYGRRGVGTDGFTPRGGADEAKVILDGAAQGRPDGMYTIAAQRLARPLRLERDSFGIKPLFMRQMDNGLAFCSEIRPLVRRLGAVTPDLAAIDEILLFGRPLAERTALTEIKRFPRGARMDFRTFDQFDALPHVLSGPGNEALPAEAELDDALRNSVRKCLISDRPVGIAVSGGIDSGMICSYVNELGAEDITTFSVLVDGDGLRGPDEIGLPFGGAWQNWRHETVNIDPDNYITLFADAARVMGEPNRMSSAPLYLALARLVSKQRIKVLLTGEGVDELFMGYQSHAEIVELLESTDSIGDVLVDATCSPALARWVEELVGTMRVKSAMQRLRDYIETLKHPIPDVTFRRLKEELSLEPLLHRADHALMAHSIEGRVPYLHGAVPDIAYRYRAGDLVQSGEGKRPVRRLAEQRLSIASSVRPKVPFRAPIAKWMQTDANDWIRSSILDARPAFVALGLNPHGLERLLDAGRGGDGPAAALITTLLSMAFWHNSTF